MKAISLFSCAGIGELMLNELGIDIIAANEIVKSRSEVYQYLHRNTEMINGDIREDYVKKRIISFEKYKPKLLLATPPCQGLSTVGKNKLDYHFSGDSRNFLIFDIIEIIKSFNFDYILIENVPKYLEMFFPFDGEYIQILDLLKREIGDLYTIDGRVFNAKEYGVPQSRPRSIIRIKKKGYQWHEPTPQRIINLMEAIGGLPSLSPGEKSNIKWHLAKEQKAEMTLALSHTPTGCSALNNPVYFPKNAKGEKVRGFHNTYKRMIWTEPAHARTTYNGSVSSHNNVHPGKKLSDGTYSDPRALTILETLIVSSINPEIDFPENISDSFLRTLIGEGVPPRFMYELIKPICLQE